MFQISPTLFGVGPNSKQTLKNKEGNQEEATEDDKLCVVCFDNPHNTVLDPCGHGGVCNNCIKDILTKKISTCPLCRESINLVIVYKKDEEGRFEQIDEYIKDRK